MSTDPMRTPTGGDAHPAVPEGGSTVLVVGAGVSGCACAAALAQAGLRVTLINSAMDRVGLPAYGPDVAIGASVGADPAEAMGFLPQPLRSVWLEAASRPEAGAAVLNVDRRRVSVETKRLLEQVSNLEFRQGFIVDVRTAGADSVASSVEAETIFGEIFEADALVIACGLSLDGRSEAGHDVAEGGRYGEPGSEGLAAALKRLGVEFRATVLDVGPRALARDLAKVEEASRAATPGGKCLEARHLGEAASPEEVSPWPGEFPPAPHLDKSFRFDVSLGVADEHGGWLPLVSPDGSATAELYVAPRLAQNPSLAQRFPGGLVLTRMPVRVTAQVATGLSAAGRLGAASGESPVWLVGRCAGAEDYLESLRSGVRAAADIVAALGGRG